MRWNDLRRRVLSVLERPVLSRELVIGACDRLSRQMLDGAYEEMLQNLETTIPGLSSKLTQAARMLSRDALEQKVLWELDGLPKERTAPLGVLLHIGASNLDGLAAYSVVEGLLAGNINLLKLSRDDDGINTLLLSELVKTEPVLKDYIYVFRIPSTDTGRLKKLMDLADGISVWGGDEAVLAIRKLAGPNTKLIEWGHKISFAYAAEEGCGEAALRGLAENIIGTGQLLCSSCQGIFLDTENTEAAEAFCVRFLKILEDAFSELSQGDAGRRACHTLELYNRELENDPDVVRIYRGRGVSVTLCSDNRLELSDIMGNCWVKPLPRRRIVETLRDKKGYLQTAVLVCGQKDRAELTSLLVRAGVVRIRPGEEMDTLYPGQPHDGEYPLIRYSRVIDLRE
ncbi:acyl-CoA reductase [Clostridium sp. MCC353]|uniref:acyl-CoA reductase n=1 Tax=Clostridium sp. MCC353 TaxID=2592646 RepID=UPI001C02569E|nr:acyl-CoA reductase [Clostridium sp. MCC353]